MIQAAFSFSVETSSKECLGRTGVIQTRRGPIKTPVFMPVGTQGTVKTLSPADLEEIGASIILGNTYHLMLRPGTEVLDHFGGLHRMMAWNRPLLTDSGGFQVFSLKTLNQIGDEGVTFASHLNGERHFLSPEGSMKIQRSIGGEIIMAFDECCPYPADEATAATAMTRSVEWAKRCRKDHPVMENGQALFGIIQGSTFPNLRRESLEKTAAIGFEGLAIGGLSVGEPKEIMAGVLDELMPLVPRELPRYLMGVGAPDDLFMGVERGIDMFDCVLPTRIARHGSVFTKKGRIDLTALPWKKSEQPMDEECRCYACKTFSRGYLRHLFKAKEILALRMASLHNLCFLTDLMKEIRHHLEKGTFLPFKQEFLRNYFRKEGE